MVVKYFLGPPPVVGLLVPGTEGSLKGTLGKFFFCK